MDELRQVFTFPYQLQGILGNRTFPIVPGEQPIAMAIPGIDDEAADEPEDEVIPIPVGSAGETAIVPMLTIDQAGPPVPSLGVTGPVTPGMKVDTAESGCCRRFGTKCEETKIVSNACWCRNTCSY